MEINREVVDSLILNPSESLNVELKTWIDPGIDFGISKIIRATFALYNRNGGFLLIGFNNESSSPDLNERPDNVRSVFHIDNIQSLISRYASISFPIEIQFGLRDSLEYPIIIVPSGVTTPVAAKLDLFAENGKKKLIERTAVYFRTMNSNGIISSAPAQPNDWPDIVQICFDNREANIGRFLRSHLNGADVKNILSSIEGLSLPAPPTLSEQTQTLLVEGEQRLETAVAGRELSNDELNALDGAAWSIAAVITPALETSIPNKNFLQTLGSANPRLTGWPVWLDARTLSSQDAWPHVKDNGWEAFIVSLNFIPHIDFMRLDPKGEFYLWRLMPDDLTDKVQPGTSIDAVIVILRTTEAIAVALSFAKALSVSEESVIGFRFKWEKLEGRRLTSWSNWMVSIGGGTSYQDMVETFTEVPANTAIASIAPYVDQATKALFAIFDGYEFSKQAIEDWVQKLLERKL